MSIFYLVLFWRSMSMLDVNILFLGGDGNSTEKGI